MSDEFSTPPNTPTPGSRYVYHDHIQRPAVPEEHTGFRLYDAGDGTPPRLQVLVSVYAVNEYWREWRDIPLVLATQKAAADTPKDAGG